MLRAFAQYGTLFACIAIVWYILLAIGLWKMFEKAGLAGWKGLIPIYNFYLLFKISWNTRMFWAYLILQVIGGLLMVYADNNMMYYLAMAITIVIAIIMVVFFYNISLAYGHGLGYFIGLYFLTPLFIMIIGFGKSQYIGNRYNHAALV